MVKRILLIYHEDLLATLAKRCHKLYMSKKSITFPYISTSIVNPIDKPYQFDSILGARFRIILISNNKVTSPSRSCAVCAKEKQTPTNFISIQLVGVPRTVTTASENPSVIPTRFISNP